MSGDTLAALALIVITAGILAVCPWDAYWRWED